MTCWTQALHEYLLASPPSGVDEEAIRALLCSRRRQIDPVPEELACTLRAWLSKSPILSYRHALSSALPHREDFNRLGGPLLSWGLTRPWCSDIEVGLILGTWRRVLNEPNLFSDALAANMAYATRLMVDVLALLPEKDRLVAAKTWTEEVMIPSPRNVLWQPNMYRPDVRGLVLASWADMHTIARVCFGALATEMWQNSVKKAFDNSSLNHPENALALVRSPLPDDIKLRGVFGANAQAWLHPELLAEMAPLLLRTSPDPRVRIHSLPWAFASSFDDWRDRVDFQRRLCETYCPELVPVFALCQVDWTDRVSVLRVASMFTADKESFDVAGLVNNSAFGF